MDTISEIVHYEQRSIQQRQKYLFSSIAHLYYVSHTPAINFNFFDLLYNQTA